MTSDQLRQRLWREGFQPGVDFHLDGNPGLQDGFAIAHEAGAWVVAYFERGGRNDVATFGTEAEACAELYRRLWKYTAPARRLKRG